LETAARAVVVVLDDYNELAFGLDASVWWTMMHAEWGWDRLLLILDTECWV
jgi:hypothetical protein